MKLFGRLKLIADMIPCCNTLYDIGTDHAYIPIYAAGKGIYGRAVAVDVRPKPIQAAADNIRIHHLSDRVEARLSDGLSTIRPERDDVVVLAGMGGLLMIELLERDLTKAMEAGYLILQPMQAVENVRRWLYGSGFCITDERLVAEGTKLYDVIAARFDGRQRTADDMALLVGDVLMEKEDPLLGKWIEKKLSYFKKRMDGLAARTAHDPAEMAYLQETVRSLERIAANVGRDTERPACRAGR